MTKIILITGFLGSGKTTLLKELLAEYCHTYKAGVIQNEYSGASIDGMELKSTKLSFELIEINRGSIFCICLYSDFREQLDKFVEEVKPDIIFIEASGLSDPVSIATMFNDSQGYYLSKVVSLVDAVHFLDVHKTLGCVTGQIKVADIVVVNKCDRVNTEQLRELEKKVLDINPAAEIILTSFAKSPDLPGKVLAGYTTKAKLSGLSPGLTTEPVKNIVSHVFKSTKKADYNKLCAFALSVPDGVLRIKGYIYCKDEGGYMIQYTGGDASATLTPVSNVKRTELIFLGYQIPQINFI